MGVGVSHWKGVQMAEKPSIKVVVLAFAFAIAALIVFSLTS